MGNYISYDRNQAQAYARTIRKQQERKQRAEEERRIWNELVEAEIRAGRERAAATAANGKRPRALRAESPVLSAQERGLMALELAIAAIDVAVSAEIKGLRDGRVPWRSSEVSWVQMLAVCRHYGFFVSSLDTNSAAHLWLHRAGKLLGEAAFSTIADRAAEAAHIGRLRICMAARDVLCKSKPDVRREVLCIWRDFRREDHPSRTSIIVTREHERAAVIGALKGRRAPAARSRQPWLNVECAALGKKEDRS